MSIPSTQGQTSQQNLTKVHSTSFKLPVWLIVLVVGLPIFSETVYSPALPDIAQALGVSDSWVEYTLTIYLFGFALGTFFWGRWSDKWGRRPCMLAGLLIYVVGCLGCYLSASIEMLMISRLVQAFGGSTGSVLGQAISRDAFHGPALGKMYATVGAALAIFPAAGPVVGGVIDQRFGWSAIFLFLIGAGIFVLTCVAGLLPETHTHENRQKVSLLATFLRMIKDPHVLGCGLLVAIGNGIAFSYFAEGPFVMIELLGLTPSEFGLSFMGMAGASFLGGVINRRLHNHYGTVQILNYGIAAMVIAAFLMVGLVFTVENKDILIAGILGCMMLFGGGTALLNSNSLSLSLVAYKNSVGTASSLFGFYYYTLISVATLGMGYLHQDTLYPMPLYFAGLCLALIFIKKLMVREVGH